MQEQIGRGIAPKCAAALRRPACYLRTTRKRPKQRKESHRAHGVRRGKNADDFIGQIVRDLQGPARWYDGYTLARVFACKNSGISLYLNVGAPR